MIYLTEDEIVTNIITTVLLLSTNADEQLNRVRSSTREGMKECESAIVYIKNVFKLHDRNNPLTYEWYKDVAMRHERALTLNTEHPSHPDQVCIRILGKIWDKITEESYE